jgi:branched-chain amino acid transport system ATP-binding protein
MTARLLRIRRNFLWQAIHFGPAEQEELAHRPYAERIIDFLEIQAIRKTPVGRLPYGLQKRVELGRALAIEPELLLLDEPMAGMNVEEKEDDRVVVLDYGRKIADGPPEDVRTSPEVIAAYLGEAHTQAPHPAPAPSLTLPRLRGREGWGPAGEGMGGS